jgi:hypothetical protein
MVLMNLRMFAEARKGLARCEERGTRRREDRLLSLVLTNGLVEAVLPSNGEAISVLVLDLDWGETILVPRAILWVLETQKYLSLLRRQPLLISLSLSNPYSHSEFPKFIFSKERFGFEMRF